MTRSRILCAITLALLALTLLAAPIVLASDDSNAAATSAEVEVELAADSMPLVEEPLTQHPEFVATHEWQVVLPGQPIPAGLHVRMDVTTGVKTAKLIPEEELNDAGKKLNAQRALDKEMALVLQECDPISDASCDVAPVETSGPTLKVLPEPGGEAPLDSVSPQSEAALMAARQERMRLLKEHFYLKEDVEQMKQLLNVCIDPASSVEQVVQALEYLEEYLHQIDNANDWSHIGGLDVSLTFLQQSHEPLTESVPVASPSSNETDTATGAASTAPPAPVDLQLQRLYNLQAHAAWVLGTASQNNPRVQDVCRRDGAVQILTNLYARTVAEEKAAAAAPTPSSDSPSISLFQLRSSRLKLLSKLLYALSALLRNSARNQAIFHALNGEDLLLQGANVQWRRCDKDEREPMKCVNENEHNQLLKLVDSLTLKRVNLLHDFIVDHTINSLESTSKVTGVTMKAKADVSDPKLFDALTTDRFCAHFVQVIEHPAAEALHRFTATQLTTRELALQIVQSLLRHHHSSSPIGLCSAYFHAHPGVDAALAVLQKQHQDWAAEAALEETTADEAAEGLTKYHLELRDAIVKVRELLKQ